MTTIKDLIQETEKEINNLDIIDIQNNIIKVVAYLILNTIYFYTFHKNINYNHTGRLDELGNAEQLNPAQTEDGI